MITGAANPIDFFWPMCTILENAKFQLEISENLQLEDTLRTYVLTVKKKIPHLVSVQVISPVLQLPDENEVSLFWLVAPDPQLHDLYYMFLWPGFLDAIFGFLRNIHLDCPLFLLFPLIGRAIYIFLNPLMPGINHDVPSSVWIPGGHDLTM